MGVTQFSFDRTGFPLVRLEQEALEVHVLPVTKVQFERFLAEPNEFGDHWYAPLLDLNPRTPFRQFAPSDREKVFLTGILPHEALAFARWLGPKFDLPTVNQWRAIYHALKELRLKEPGRPAGDSARQQTPCEHVLGQCRSQLDTRTLFDLSLMSGGLLEWSRSTAGWVGLGSPRPAFFKCLYDPLTDEIRPSDQNERVAYFGFRLVRRLG